MKDLMFHEMLDKPFDQKSYRLQLEEFAYRGERIVKQVDQKMGEVQTMVSQDVLCRSRSLPDLLRGANDELRRAHKLICSELEDVWHMRFEPFFYPSEEEGGEAFEDECLGGWLDLDDMFLTSRLLVRCIRELVGLIGMAVKQLPDEVVDSREHMSSRPPHPMTRQIMTAFAARVPWIGAALASDAQLAALQSERSPREASQEQPLSPTADPRRRSSAMSVRSVMTAVTGKMDLQGKDHGATDQAAADLHQSPLNRAITALDSVLTVHVKLLLSDLHRTTYQTFVKLCAAYARWKRSFADERQRALVQCRRSSMSVRPSSFSALGKDGHEQGQRPPPKSSPKRSSTFRRTPSSSSDGIDADGKKRSTTSSQEGSRRSRKAEDGQPKRSSKTGRSKEVLSRLQSLSEAPEEKPMYETPGLGFEEMD